MYCENIEKAFSYKQGRLLATRLIKHIVKYESFSNWDECLEALIKDLFNLVDTCSDFPKSQFTLAELKLKLKNLSNNFRYKVKINENI